MNAVVCSCHVGAPHDVRIDATLQPCGAKALDPKSDIARAVAALTVGPYAAFAGFLAQRCDQRVAVRAHDLLDRTMRSRLAAATDGEEYSAKALHLQWIERFAEVFLPPILLADVLLKRSPLVDLDRLEFVVGADGLLNAYRILGSDDIPHSRALFRFEKLVFHHLLPLVELWAERTGIPQRVMWASIAREVEATLETIQDVSGVTERLVEARDLARATIWPNGRANPLFRT
jgi:ferric iron reductase protein FhuF